VLVICGVLGFIDQGQNMVPNSSASQMSIQPIPATIMSTSETGEYNGRYVDSIALFFLRKNLFFQKMESNFIMIQRSRSQNDFRSS